MKIKENEDDGAGKNSRVKTDGFGRYANIRATW